MVINMYKQMTPEEYDEQLKKEMDRWEMIRNANIDKANGFPIYEHTTDAGTKTVSNKPQYVRGGWIFHCPYCDWTSSSHSFLNVGYWEKEVLAHVGEKHSDNLSHPCPHCREPAKITKNNFFLCTGSVCDVYQFQVVNGKIEEIQFIDV